MFVYLLTNLLEGKRYVGQTNLSPESRFLSHIRASKNTAKRRQSAIASAIYKYGQEAFSLTVLETCSSQADLDLAEIKWISTLGTLSPDGYNLRTGGIGGRMLPSAKLKLSEARKGIKQSPELVERRIAPLRGRPRSDHARKAISEKLKGRVNTWGPKAAATNRERGHGFSPVAMELGTIAGHAKQAEMRANGLLSFHGERNPNAKLTPEIVMKIRALYSTGDFSQQDLADEFGVKQVAISRIVRFKSWVKP